MNELPRVLIVDDQWGPETESARAMRRAFCLLAGLVDGSDATHGDAPRFSPDKDEPLATAVFHSGQRIVDGQVENDLEGTIRAIKAGWTVTDCWALVLLDLEFRTGEILADGTPKGRKGDTNPESYFGLKVLEGIREDPELNDLPVVLLSAMNREEIERRFAKQGVLDFLDKEEIDRKQGRPRMRDVLLANGLIRDIRPAPERRIVGGSRDLLICLRQVRRRARSGRDNILLLGETGTGKDLLASYAHDYAPCSHGPFVPVLTHTVNEGMLPDTLFGHVKGAFPDARADRKGAAEMADGGTLFIDEFGDIPDDVQLKLLRLLDPNLREVQRIGDTKIRKLKLQVVLGTNRLDLIRSDKIRRDIKGRVKASDPIVVPPLRERMDDLQQLVEFFVKKVETHLGPDRCYQGRTVDEDVISYLREHDWSENIRELEGEIETAVNTYSNIRHLTRAQFRLPSGRSTTTATAEVDPPPFPPDPPPPPPLPPDDALTILERWSGDAEAPFTGEAGAKDRLRGRGDTVLGGAAAAMLSFLEQAVLYTEDELSLKVSATRVYFFTFQRTVDEKGKKLDSHKARAEIARLFALDKSVTLRALRRSDRLLRLAVEVTPKARRPGLRIEIFTELAEDPQGRERLEAAQRLQDKQDDSSD